MGPDVRGNAAVDGGSASIRGAVAARLATARVRCVWQGSGSSKNNSGSGFLDVAAFLVELEPF